MSRRCDFNLFYTLCALIEYNITLSWTLSLNFDKWRDRTLIMDAVDSELLIYGSFHFNSTEIQ